MDSKFLVGFADVIMTPDEPMPMGGFGNTSMRIHNCVLEDLHAPCTVMTDEDGETVVMITTDTTRAYPNMVAMMRPLISEKTGIPQDHIMISCTHTHSGPDLLNSEQPAVPRFLEKLKVLLLQGVLDALADRKPAQIFVGHTKTEKLNFVKHYKHVTEEGETKFFGDNFGTPVYDHTTDHTTQVDTTMHLIRFKREGGKDVVLANWRAHPQLTGGRLKLNMSADYPGPFRSILGAQLDCHVHFIQGAAGNVNPKSRLEHENYSTDHNVFGARLAYYALKCLENNMQAVPAGKLRTLQVQFEGQINHQMDHMVDTAQKILDFYAKDWDLKAAYAYARTFGIASTYYAVSIIAKSKLGKTETLELNAIAIGDHVAFVTAPNELFDTNSMYTEQNSPFAMTFTCGYANNHVFYIPSKFGYEYGCYESHVSRFAPGTGEQISETFLEMLNALKDN